MGREGSGVRSVSSSSIEITFQYKGKRCRERLRMKPSGPNIKWANNLRGKILLEIEKGIFCYQEQFPNSKNALFFVETPGEILIIKKYLSDWLKGYKLYTQSSTWNDYRKIVNNRLIPAFGHLTLVELKRKHIKDWLLTLTCSDKTKGNIISPFRVALSDAVEDDLIQINVLAGWKIKRSKENSRNKKNIVSPFSIDEIKAILKVLSPQMRNFFQFAF